MLEPIVIVVVVPLEDTVEELVISVFWLPFVPGIKTK